ncbi:MAG: L-seryl-tRNA(Sec) selenium transferase, partial [Chloroflexi bacterium]|nr:L-seryl-tRNA(Sec) selenium transferase [Chloroflexota bacterium]
MTTKEPQHSDYRRLPGVDRLLAHPLLQEFTARAGHDLLVAIAREALEEARGSIALGAGVPSMDELAQGAALRLGALLRPRPRPVINATGIVIHTNLGRAPLSRAAQEAVLATARSYSDLEYDLEAGDRGSRHAHAEELLRRLTGAEAAIAVNNNASAVLLALATLAAGKEVVVSRGEAVEIGGGFRIPDVLRQSGAHLVEVGTTNRTYARDYEAAITPETAAILKVHRSNFALVGFTHTPEARELAELAHRRGIPLLHDLGSGCLLDTTRYGLAAEPRVQESVAEGADLSLFSGDKLLGGPQAGIAVGRGAVVERMKAHPLARAVRMDKLDLAALTATLVSYLTGRAEEEIPVWRMIAAPLAELERRARAWAAGRGEGVEVVKG